MILLQIKKIINLAIPAMLSNSVVLLGILINTHTLGIHDKNSLYWLALFMPYNFIMTALFQALSVTTISLNSFFPEDKKNNLYLGSIYSLIIYTVLFFVFLSFASFYFNNFYIKDDYQRDFFNIFSLNYILSNIPVGIWIIFNSMIYSKGKAKISFILTAISTIICCTLTILFFKEFRNGLNSLTCSVLFSYLFFSLIAFIIISKIKTDPTFKFFVKLRFKYPLIALYKFGFPIVLIYGTLCFSLFIFNKILSPFGNDVVSGFGLGYRIQNFLIIPAIAIGISSGILINKSISQKVPHEAKQILLTGLSLSFLFYFFVSCASYLFRYQIVSLLTTDENVKVYALKYLYYLSFSYLGLGPGLSFFSILEQTGHGFRSFLFNSLTFGFQILLGSILVNYYHNIDIFYKTALTVNLALLALILLEIFFDKKYQSNISKIQIIYKGVN